MPTSENNIYYTYVYLDPRKPGRYSYGDFITFFYEPYYVGKGKENRIYDHLKRNIETKRNIHKSKKIKNIILEEFKPEEYIIKVIKDVEEKCAFCYEIYFINIIGRHDLSFGPLCNHSNGGEGSFSKESVAIRKKNGWFKSEESRKSFSEKISLNNSITSKGNKNCLGKIHNEETRKKISIKNKLRYKDGQTEEHRRKNSESIKEKWKDENYRLKMMLSRRRSKNAST